MKASVDVVEDAMPFVFRFTNKGGGQVALDLGDDFELSPAFGGGDDAVMRQIGLALVRFGTQFLGCDAETSKMVSLLAMKSAGELVWGDDDDD